MTTLGTLVGLLGTVIGMIRAFAALANAGAVSYTHLPRNHEYTSRRYHVEKRI